MVMTSTGIPGEIKVFLNHIYEYKKGVRNMVLCTLNKCYEPIAVERLESQKICFIKQGPAIAVSIFTLANQNVSKPSDCLSLAPLTNYHLKKISF